ncbi:MAG: hypothetical protein IPO63_05540, partial [Bacteroidetes bacterium]|nr:hypothetical protein [Bacteroidota bacterium]
MMEKELHPINFYDVKNAFDKYVSNLKIVRHKEGKGEEEGAPFKGYNQFKRWEWFHEQRLYPSGSYPASELLWDELDAYNLKWRSKNKGANLAGVNTSSWTNLSFPYVPAGSSAGMGRINCMAFMPGNPSTIFIGAATGGVWKSIDNGINWIPLNTDALPSLSITEIVINPTDTNEIFIATGDMFAGFPGIGKSLQGHFSAGILKSSDGG